MATTNLLAPLKDADHREMGGVLIDTVRTGNSRVKRIVYPAGFRWSQTMKPLIGTALCQHAHVGFLASGHLRNSVRRWCYRRLCGPAGGGHCTRPRRLGARR